MSEQPLSSSSLLPGTTPVTQAQAQAQVLEGGPGSQSGSGAGPYGVDGLKYGAGGGGGSFEKRLAGRTARFKPVPHIAVAVPLPIPVSMMNMSMSKSQLRVGPAAGTGSVATSGCLQIAGGLSPAALLDSPVLLPSTQAEPSPTTGTFPLPPFFHGGGTRVASADLSRDRSAEEGGGQPASFVFKPFFGSAQAAPAPAPRASPLSLSLSTLAGVGQLMAQGGVGGGAGGGGEGVEVYEAEMVTRAEDDGRSTRPLVEKPAEDGYNWRKYGQKQVKGCEYPRSYYKCTHPGCPVKKKVERSEDGQVTQRVYKGKHSHPKPMPSRRVSVLHPALGLSDASPSDLALLAEALPEDPSDERLRAVGASGCAANDCKDGALVPLSSDAPAPGKPKGWQGEHESDSSEDVGEEDGGRPAGCDDMQEADAKRRKMEKREGPSNGQKVAREPRLVIQATSEVEILDDGYRWRKYGQKVVKGNPHPRSYYKCTSANCPVRKHVERSSMDPKEVITTYEGKHNHEVPALRVREDQSKEGPSGTPVSGLTASSTGGGGTPASLVSDGISHEEREEEQVVCGNPSDPTDGGVGVAEAEEETAQRESTSRLVGESENL